MIEVSPGLYVGDQLDYETKVKPETGWAIVHACKEPYHRQALGYKEQGAPKTNPEYLFALRDFRLCLNLVDAADPAYIPAAVVDRALAFITEHLTAGRKVLVHCNQGQSRGPGLALLWMTKTGKLQAPTPEQAAADFRALYPAYAPAKGMAGFIAANWASYRPAPVVAKRNRWKPRRVARDNKLPRLRAFVQRTAKEKGEQAAAQAIRKLCREDLFYLCVEILGYKDLEEPLHDDLCDFLAYAAREKKTNVVLVPRGHFKSTIATVGRCIQWILQDQNTAIGLGSSDKTNAEKFLREIRGHLETNARLKALFPEILYDDPQREADKWTQEEIIVRRTVAKKEGTIKVFGLEDALPTGDHYPHLIVDDAVNEDNIRTEDRIKKINEQAKYLIPLLMTPDQPINWVGTRYHIFDVYQGLIDDENNAVYLRQDIEEGAPIFPSRFTKPILEATRVKLGTYIYNCQYRMEPTDPAMKKFRREWLKWYRKEIGKRHGHVFFMTVDPASRRRKSSDFTAITVWGVDKDWNFFLVDGVHDKLNAGQRIDAVFRLVKKWGIEIVGYETIGFQETDEFYIKQRQHKDGVYFLVVPIESHNTRKDERIEGLQPIMQAGQFWLPEKPIPYIRLWESPDDGKGKEVDITQEFLAEFDFYPNAAHDDLLDSAQMARHIVYAGHVPRPKDHVPVDADYGMHQRARQEEHQPYGV